MTTTLEAIQQGAITVRDLMQSEVVTVSPDMTIRELVKVLAEHAISGAPVVDRGGRLVGVVSATDVVRMEANEAEIPAGQIVWGPAALPEEDEQADEDAASYYLTPQAPARFTAPYLSEGSAMEECTVAEIMTPVAFTVDPSDTAADLIRFFLRGRIHRAPVVERGVLLGIVTPFDVLRAVAQEDVGALGAS